MGISATIRKVLRGAPLPALLGVIAFLVACMAYGRWSARDWQQPFEYGTAVVDNDVLGMQLAPIKAASEGHFPLFASKKIPEFGAPYEASWDDFPTIEEFHVVLPGLLARWIGLFPALNLFGILAHVTSALGFYLACRLLGIRREWACAGALAFGFSLYIFARGLHHLAIGWAGHVPLMIVVARWAFSSGEKSGLLRRAHFGWALAIAAVSGVQHVYYTNMLMQFLGLAVLYQAFHRRWRSALRAIFVGAAAMFTLLLVNFDTFSSRFLNGPNPGALTRTYQYLELSGLKLADLFIPPPGYWVHPLGAWGNRYFSEVVLPGEMPVGSFLGVVGGVALLWLVVASLFRLAQMSQRPHPRRPAWEFLLALWVVAYATVGGINAWIGSLGFVLFRSTTRYSIFLLALALLYATRRLGTLTRHWKVESRIALAGAVAALALWDQIPRVLNEEPAAVAAAIDSDRKFAGEMESHLKPGAMVFELPMMDFPECPVPGVASYEQFRPYLFTKHLRYSFGDVKGRANTAWQAQVALLKPEAMMEQLEAYGFGAIMVNRNGYADGAKALLDAAASRAATVFQSTRGDLACIVLRPAASPVLPPPGPRFGKGWMEPVWNRPDLQVRGCEGNASIALMNPTSGPVERYLHFVASGIDNREATMEFHGVSTPLPLQPGRELRATNLRVELQPGENLLSFRCKTAPVQTRLGPLAFHLINFQITEKPLAQ